MAWTSLGVGMLLGAHWAYEEIGWGGFWAWDPVENAALIPWLVGTAFLHSVIVQEKKGMLKIWNVALIALTVRPLPVRHVPDPLGRAQLGARFVESGRRAAGSWPSSPRRARSRRR